MPEEVMLRDKAREQIRNGKIPLRRPDRTWGGPGVGGVCAICDERVTRKESEVAISFYRSPNAAPWLDKYLLHTHCFAVWEHERELMNGG